MGDSSVCPLAHISCERKRREMSEGEYSVCQFFPNGTSEYVRRYVGELNAIEAFAFYTSSIAAKNGFVTRVIITDGGDCINLEWEYGKGITFPPELTGKTRRIKS
jgi:hypothetical protein